MTVIAAGGSVPMGGLGPSGYDGTAGGGSLMRRQLARQTNNTSGSGTLPVTKKEGRAGGSSALSPK